MESGVVSVPDTIHRPAFSTKVSMSVSALLIEKGENILILDSINSALISLPEKRPRKKNTISASEGNSKGKQCLGC